MRKKAVKSSGPEPSSSPPDLQPSMAIDAASIKLAANLDLTMAIELSRTILAARGSDLVIDASDVHHLGAQCGQILVSAKMTWEADQQPLRIAGGSAEFIEGARLLGLQSALHDEDARS